LDTAVDQFFLSVALRLKLQISDQREEAYGKQRDSE
jgi:hypothetical protein